MPLDMPPYVPPKVAPAPGSRSPLGLVRAMLANPVAAIPAAAYHAPVVETRPFGRQVVFLAEPEAVERVLLREVDGFPKSRIDERLFVPLFGDGLLTATGDDWRWKRRLAAPAFRERALGAYLPAITGPFERLAARWAAAPGPQPVAAAMTAAALEVVCGALFSGFDELDGRRLSDAIARYLAPVSWTTALGTLGLPAATPHPGRLSMLRAAREARRLVAGFIARRRAAERRDDLAQALIEARDPETGRALADDDLVDMFLTLLAAGHETTANALAWALLCLADQPARQEALAAAVRDRLGTRAPAVDDLAALAPLERFVKETLRLFPPGPLMARRATRPTELAGVALRPGALIFLPVYAIHRHAALWERPAVFEPDRFAPEAERGRHRCAFMPFGAGPRICIGGAFAMLEMVLGLAVLLRALRLRPGDAPPPEPIQRITLRPARELYLAIAPRP